MISQRCFRKKKMKNENVIKVLPLFVLVFASCAIQVKRPNETGRLFLSKLKPDQQITVIGKVKRIRYVTGGFGDNPKRNWIELTNRAIVEEDVFPRRPTDRYA